MRKYIFLRILHYLEKHPSGVFDRLQIQILLFATAKAFQKKGKWELFSGDALKEYAEFTRECMGIKAEGQENVKDLKPVTFSDIKNFFKRKKDE